MPLYEYRCESCGKVFEILQRLVEAPVTECSTCKGVLVKMASAPALQFKGTGWYVTDYARSSDPGTGSASGDSKSDGDAKSSSDAPSNGDSKSSKESSVGKESTGAQSTGSTSSETKPVTSGTPVTSKPASSS